jgi:uncharacterized protein with WD repeat
LIVWNVQDGKQIASFTQKAFNADLWYFIIVLVISNISSFRPSIKWNDEETICARMVTNEIQFYEGNFNNIVR